MCFSFKSKKSDLNHAVENVKPCFVCCTMVMKGRFERSGQTAHHWTLQCERESGWCIVLSQTHSLDFEDTGLPPLTTACLLGNYDIAELLVDQHKANIE